MSNTTASLTEIVLVSMPWAPPHEPALGLGILKASLRRQGFSTRVFHAAPRLLRWITPETYQFLADCWGLNEFLFSAELDSSLLDSSQEARLEERVNLYASTGRHVRYRDPASLARLIGQMREEVAPLLLADMEDRIAADSPAVVGFTCLFDQTIASLALAKRLKARLPGLPIVFGGYALAGPPGETVAKAFPWIDAVVLGDGEDAIVDIAKQVRAGTFESRGKPRHIVAARVDMAASPTPDYSDWFADTRELANHHAVEVRTRVLPIEASRGCWWGANKHCTFCGIDDDTLQYRYKPASVTLAMLHEMRDRYGHYVFRFSDYIMPKVYYSELLPLLAEEPRKFSLHSEIKANHPPDRVKLLSQAGFHEVQPGIESFSTPVLRAMDKGCRGIDNVSLLKAGYANRIDVHYNILYGLPSDTLDDYLAMLERIPRIYHLTPPMTRNETVVTRFAPLQANPKRFGIETAPVHHRCYDLLFSQRFLESSGFSLDSYAYYFERNFEYPPELKAAYSQLSLQVDHWKALHRARSVELSWRMAGEDFEIVDSRYANEESYHLPRSVARVYMTADDRPVILERAAAAVRADFGMSTVEFDECVRELDDRRLIWVEGNLILGLAVEREVSAEHRQTAWCQEWMSLFA